MGRPVVRRIIMLYLAAPFLMTLNDSKPRCQGCAMIWRWMSQKRYDIQNYNYSEELSHTHPTQGCHFAWPWVTYRNIQWHEASRGHAGVCLSFHLISHIKRIIFSKFEPRFMIACWLWVISLLLVILSVLYLYFVVVFQVLFMFTVVSVSSVLPLWWT